MITLFNRFGLLLYFFSLLIVSCNSDESPPVLETGFFEQGFEVVWETNLLFESDFTSYSFLTEDFLIVPDDNKLIIYDPLTGAFLKDFNLSPSNFDKRAQNQLFQKNKISLCPYGNLSHLNLDNDELIISEEDDFKGNLAHFEEDYVIATYDFDEKVAAYWQAPIGSENRTLIHEVRDENFTFLAPRSTGLERNDLEEEILYSHLDKVLLIDSLGELQDNNYIIAYNLSSSELLWEKKIGIENSNTWAASPILTTEALIYRNPTLFALNKLTGEPLWQTDLEIISSDWNLAKLSDGILLVKNNSKMLGIDALTGIVQWEIPNIDPYNTEVKNGKVFLTNQVFGNNLDDKVFLSADIKTGEILWQVKAPEDSWGRWAHFHLDPNENIMYTLGNSIMRAVSYPE